MTVPVVVRFNLPAAQDALARSDEGVKALPGDAELIAAYEGYCQQEYDKFQQRCADAELADWLATQCPACETGGLGEVCDDCADEPGELLPVPARMASDPGE